jgi:signal transduction histidine kinase
MSPRWLETKDRIGGRYALSLAVFLIGSPFWILGFVFNEPASFTTVDGFITGLGLATAGQVAMGLTLWLGHLTVGRHRSERPMSLTVACLVWSASALARIGVIVVGLDVVGLPDDVPLGTRIAASALLATVGYAIGSYALDALVQFRDQRADLLKQLLDSDDQLFSHRSTVLAMKTALVERVDQQMDESRESSTRSLDQLEQALLERSDAKPALDELRQLSDETWKRVSGDLWLAAPQEAPKMRTRELLNLYASAGPFRLPMLAVVALFLYLLLYSRVFDDGVGALVSLAWLGGAVVFGLIANWVLGKLRRYVLTALGVSLGIMIFSSIPLLFVAQLLGLSASSPLRVVGVHAISVMMATVTSLPAPVTLARQAILDNLQRHIGQATLEKLHVESQLAIVSQKLASRLHGDVRGNFLAAVLNLQRHIDEAQVHEALDDIAKLRIVLSERLEIASAERTDAELLTEFIVNWSAILDVSFESPLAHVPYEFMPAVHTVVVDAINNAVRHGGADWVRIGFALEPDALILTIRNNGTHRESNRVGLGTRHLNQVAPDKWSRYSDAHGIVQLVVRLEREHLSARSGRV